MGSKLPPKKSRKVANSNYQDDFDREFGKFRDEDEEREEGKMPKSPKELQEAYNKVSVTELTRYLWKQVEKREKEVDKRFKTTGEIYKWLRKNLEVDIVYTQSVTSKMKTAGTKKCSLCTAEKCKIWYDIHHPDKSKKLLNKKSELASRCNCKTRFLRLYTV